MAKVNAPLTNEDLEWTEEEIAEICWFRVTATDSEWDDDPASDQWDLSREEAATRIDEGDFTPPA
jgi:hypothetical protein